MSRFAAAALTAAIFSASPAGAEIEFCELWNSLPKNEKAEFVRMQAHTFLLRGAPQYWNEHGACIARDVSPWISGVDGACRPVDRMDFDGGRMLGAAVAASLVVCLAESGSAELPAARAGSAAEGAPDHTEYRSTAGRYRVRYGATWSVTTTVEEPDLDMMLRCVAEECGMGSTITFGGRYDPQTASTSTAEVLSLANSQLLTARVRNSPLVSSVEVHEEGKTTMGTLPAYQVRMTVRSSTGRVRIRHTFFTFSRGYWYNVSLHADPEKYQSARRSAEQILSTFSPL